MRGRFTMRSISHHTKTWWMAFALPLPNHTLSGLATAGLVIGLGLCCSACSPNVGVIGGGSGAGGSSVGGAGGSTQNQVDRDGGGNDTLTIRIPDSGTGGEDAPACVKTAAGSCCGNGTLDHGEECDDGNTTGGDGCSPQCIVEADYVCPVAGQPCVSTVVCGDGRISGSEQCDDGVNLSTYGMTTGCAPGCRMPPYCGDGNVDAAFGEGCDLGASNGQPGQNCDSNCQVIGILL